MTRVYKNPECDGNETSTIRIPKVVAGITICGAVHLRINDTMDFVKPTPEQIKNLHDMLCIDVVLHDDEKE